MAKNGRRTDIAEFLKEIFEIAHSMEKKIQRKMEVKKLIKEFEKLVL